MQRIIKIKMTAVRPDIAAKNTTRMLVFFTIYF